MIAILCWWHPVKRNTTGNNLRWANQAEANLWDTLTDGNIAEKKKRKRPNRNRAAAAEAIPSLKTVEKDPGLRRGKRVLR